MKDFLGKELKIDDKVILINYNALTMGKIVKIEGSSFYWATVERESGQWITALSEEIYLYGSV